MASQSWFPTKYRYMHTRSQDAHKDVIVDLFVAIQGWKTILLAPKKSIPMHIYFLILGVVGPFIHLEDKDY